MKGLLYLLVGLFGALVFHAAIFFLAVFAQPADADFEPELSGRMEVEVLSEVSERMTLFDPRPMLLPTEWNHANARNVGDVVDEELKIFKDYEYRYEKEAGGFVTTYGNSWAGGHELRDVQLAFDFPQLDRMGSGQATNPVFRESRLKVRMRNPKSGALMFEELLPESDLEEMKTKWPGWSPTTYLVTIADSFFMRGFTVLDSSGYREVDVLLEELTRDGLKNKGIWKDGPYILEVGL